MKRVLSRLAGSILLASFAGLACSAQNWQPLGPVDHVSKIAAGVRMNAGERQVTVRAVNDSTVRVEVASKGAPAAEKSWAVISESNATAPKVMLSERSDSVEISLASGSVRIMKNPLRIIFLDAQGNVINQDSARDPMAFNGAAFRVTKDMPETENYFGLGDKTTLNLRDRAFTLWNTDARGWEEASDPLYKSIPFFMGLHNGRAYGIFLDDTWRSWFDFGKTSRDSYSFGAEGGRLNYYFFFGPDPKKVLMSYADLTGKAPLPPLWALGYQQSRYSYYPEARVLEVAKTFRDKNIPCDVIYLDIDYQDHLRPFTINRDYFPTFEQMIRDLRHEGFSVIAITDLHIAKVPGYKPYDQGLSQDEFVKNPDGSVYVGKVWPGDSVFPEFTLTRARVWWGSLYKDFVGMGIRGFWNDMNEPATFDTSTRTIPLDVVDRLDDGTSVDQRAIHNVFGMLNSRATYEGLRKLENNERPFVLTRASYAGGQRYAATWTGDNHSTWNHMRISIPTLLNLGLSGFPFVGDDIGGYAGNPAPDLLTRWTELGAFNPIFRNHSETGSRYREPWVDGPAHEALRKKFIEERYRMLPYLYTLAEESSRTGLPMMRPLFLEFPQDEALATNQDEFMLGSDMLVAPKIRNFDSGYAVEFPAGDWYDYWSGKKAVITLDKNGRTLAVNPSLGELPVFIRAGAIVPEEPVVQSTLDSPQGALELRVYPGPHCAGNLYQDDGHTFNYTRGEYLRLAFTCSEPDAKSIDVRMAAPQGSFTPWFHEMRFTIYGLDAAPRSLRVDGKESRDFQYDAAEKSVTATLPYKAAPLELEIHE